MFDVKIRKTTRRGRSHTQRCEDESLVFSYNQIGVIIVFDGCSSGTDSYFASGLFAKIFKKIAIQYKTYIENINDFSPLEGVSYTLMKLFFNELKYSFYYFELDLTEILSTIVLSVVNLKTKESYSIIAGDGSIYVDGTMHTVQPNNENAPNYISYYLSSSFDDIWKNNVYKYNFKVEKTIAVLSDGIDSFKNYNENRYVNEDEKNEIIKQFFESGYLLNNKIGLSRICNIFEDKNIAPSDDLSIAHITFVEIPEKNEIIR
jgi:hypothetical protein